MMTNLFNQQTGFRLARLELYNWGTFNGEIYVMEPGGESAVLTGANGSGKSTVVDAMLTLLVDGRRRNYNLASGADSRRERTERTYVRGQYSRSRNEDELDARPNTLRDTSSHSVLLAVFCDSAQERIVTLAQVLWISSVDRVEKRYYVAPRTLGIEQHFSQRHVNARDLPDDVQSCGNNFSTYITAARKALGLGGKPKALDLFNETVAVKEIASLNNFVREHMLDRGDPDARVEVLRSQYRELSDAHAAIQRAAQQIEILVPLVHNAQEYRTYEERIAQYEVTQSLVLFYVAEKAQNLLTSAIQHEQMLRAARQSQLASTDAELVMLREDLERVKIAIGQDSVGQAKREIGGRLPLLEREVTLLQTRAERYDRQARRLDLPVYRDEENFFRNRMQAEAMWQSIHVAIESLETEHNAINLELHQAEQHVQQFDAEIHYLRNNLSNIPPKVAQIRQRISTDLKLPLEELPFCGELLKVCGNDAAWEGVIERLLHSFAQDLIVPEARYQQVSKYVNENNLQGRLVYQRVDSLLPPERLPERHSAGAMVYDKLEIKEDTQYRDWLIATLMKRFDYLCCEQLEGFQRVNRAVTQQGQIKHSSARHEKDDRQDIHDRRYYVLGWDNRDKLRRLEEELDTLQRRVAHLAERRQTARQTLEHRRNDIQASEGLLEVNTFAEIDWRTRQADMDRLQQELEVLNQQSQQLQRLETQRDNLQQQVIKSSRRRDEINRDITTIDNRINEFQRKLQKVEQQRQSLTVEQKRLWEDSVVVIEKVDGEYEPLSVETIDSRPRELGISIQRSIASFKGLQNRSESGILNVMHTFRREYPDEGASLTPDMASLKAYESIHRRLETDDLPKHQERFKQMMDRRVADNVQHFLAYLTEQERKIDRSIHELNTSLAQIDYGNGSIIQLIVETARDAEVHEFRQHLRACIPNIGDSSPVELQRAFGQIQNLIEHFNTDPNWMQRVIDVRRWRVFAAQQLNADRVQLDYYSDSSGKSGGQKAKLAYTILASAIAHQYGLQDALPGERLFRFVVVDEAFGKLDDDNARFAMQLFAQLDLQLLVVTPMEKLRVIEDYVKAYHVVVNNEQGNHSQIFNMTQTEYREHRREWQASGQR